MNTLQQMQANTLHISMRNGIDSLMYPAMESPMLSTVLGPGTLSKGLRASWTTGNSVGFEESVVA
jgi:hypothetical protein